MTTEQRASFQIIEMPPIWTPQYEVALGLQVGLVKRVLFPDLNSKAVGNNVLMERISSDLAISAVSRRYPSGAVVLNQEDRSGGLHILQKGRLSVGQGQQELTIAKTRGDYFGAFDPTADKINLKLKALEETDLLFLPTEQLRALMDQEDQDPRIANFMPYILQRSISR